MGNWRTIEIKGDVSIEEAQKMRKYLKVDKSTYESLASQDDIFYLQFSDGLCGLGEWISNDGSIESVGNVYERNCEVEDLLSEATTLAHNFPTLNILINIGDDYESLNCVGSIIVKNGSSILIDPIVKDLEAIPDEQIALNMLNILMK